MARPGQQRREVSPGVLLLLYQMFNIGYKNIPPVTLATIALQVAIYMGYIPFMDEYRIGEICVMPNRIWRLNEWYRLILPTLVHGNDMHLYYNMISFLWKGRRLEPRLGSVYFAFLLAMFSVLTNLVMVMLSVGIDEVSDMNVGAQCAVGFSGVIFALKVLANHYYPHEDSRLFGWLPVPTQLACWIELVVIQFLSPNASFVGHLAGILVGLAYVKGPLKPLMDKIFGRIVAPTTSSSTNGGSYYQERTPTDGYAYENSGQRQSPRGGNRYRGDEDYRDPGQHGGGSGQHQQSMWERLFSTIVGAGGGGGSGNPYGTGDYRNPGQYGGGGQQHQPSMWERLFGTIIGGGNRNGNEDYRNPGQHGGGGQQSMWERLFGTIIGGGGNGGSGNRYRNEDHRNPGQYGGGKYDNYGGYSGGMSEEEQMRRAMDENLKANRRKAPPPSAPPPYDGYNTRGRGNPPPSAPPPYGFTGGYPNQRQHLYPDLD